MAEDERFELPVLFTYDRFLDGCFKPLSQSSMVDLRRIELLTLECKSKIFPLNYRPNNYSSTALTSLIDCFTPCEPLATSEIDTKSTANHDITLYS